MRIGIGGRGKRKHLAGYDALGQVVDPLEIAAARGGGDMARPEQPFERALGVAPLPPARLPPVRFEVRSGERSVQADAVEQGHGLGPAFPCIVAHPGPARLAAIGLCHAPAQERMGFEGQQRGLMRPVFEQLSAAHTSRAGLRPRADTPGQAIEVRPVISANPRESRKIVRAGEHVHAVDLEQVEAVQHALQPGRAGLRRMPCCKTLCGERDAPRLGQTDALQIRHSPTLGGKAPPRKGHAVKIAIRAGSDPAASVRPLQGFGLPRHQAIPPDRETLWNREKTGAEKRTARGAVTVLSSRAAGCIGAQPSRSAPLDEECKCAQSSHSTTRE